MLSTSDLDSNGFTIIRGGIHPPLLASLQHAAKACIDDAVDRFGDTDQASTIAFLDVDEQILVTRINDLFKASTAFLNVLGSASLLEKLDILFDHEATIPVYESLLVKNPGDPYEVSWHRDMRRDPHERIVTVGVYLDAARADAGALRVIPGSHRLDTDVCTVLQRWRAGELSTVEVEADPGDVVIHDVNVVHSSSRQQGGASRRTLYFEFRSLAHVRRNTRFPDTWIRKRMALMRTAKALAASALTGEPPHRPTRFADLYADPVRIEPGEYCIATT